MKYNVGDKVRIKTFGELADGNEISCNGTIDKGVGFTKQMREMCGKEVTISVATPMGYLLEEDVSLFPYTYEDWMFEKTTVKEFKFKVGDVVRIVGQFANHGFEIGELVKVSELPRKTSKQGWYFCTSPSREGICSHYLVDERDMEIDEGYDGLTKFFDDVITEVKAKFQIGEECIIMGNTSMHSFDDGESIIIDEIMPISDSGDQWYKTGIWYVREEDMVSLEELKEAIDSFPDDLYTTTAEEMFDVVDKPRHYADKKIEVISYIQDTVDFLKVVGYEAYCIGNVIKYVSRYAHKNGVEDLKKARYYLQEVIDILEVD